jgi:hypothetical protein
MKTEYLTFLSTPGKKAIVVFPGFIDHDMMAEALCGIRCGHSAHSWDIVSAGFVYGGGCHGSSETLGLASSPKDTNLLSPLKDKDSAELPLSCIGATPSEDDPQKQNFFFVYSTDLGADNMKDALRRVRVGHPRDWTRPMYHAEALGLFEGPWPARADLLPEEAKTKLNNFIYQ